ncbi:hypothetical protein KCP70_03495 [Salmonella enterica subsp. enterica]|nr:hypothetical protein KCP70_03495 [Salmonella enterica subsp. enterica]
MLPLSPRADYWRSVASVLISCDEKSRRFFSKFLLATTAHQHRHRLRFAVLDSGYAH